MNMQALLKQAQQMQKDLGKVEAELEKKEYFASMGGKMISVIGNGKMEILSINIDESLCHPESKEDLQDLIASAVNDVLAQAKKEKDATVNNLTGGIKLPGGM